MGPIGFYLEVSRSFWRRKEKKFLFPAFPSSNDPSLSFQVIFLKRRSLPWSHTNLLAIPQTFQILSCFCMFAEAVLSAWSALLSLLFLLHQGHHLWEVLAHFSVQTQVWWYHVHTSFTALTTFYHFPMWLLPASQEVLMESGRVLLFLHPCLSLETVAEKAHWWEVKAKGARRNGTFSCHLCLCLSLPSSLPCTEVLSINRGTWGAMREQEKRTWWVKPSLWFRTGKPGFSLDLASYLQ